MEPTTESQVHYLDKEKVTRQPVHGGTPGHPGGDEKKGSVGRDCCDGRGQTLASWGGSWLLWYSVPGGDLLTCLSHGYWAAEMLQLMN